MDWDIAILIFCIILHVVGIIGCVAPVIPGPLVSFVGLWLLDYTRWADFSLTFIVVFLAIAVLVTAIDFIVPVLGTKKFGGTKWGVRGATIGLIVGFFFFPPFGIILGPFIGAFLAEMIEKDDLRKAIRSAWGSLVGFLAGVGLKLMASFAMLAYFIRALFW
jgi:uncharacterized protein YqgC (DUF456 family)